MIFGILNLNFLGYVIATLIIMQITIASVTLYLHRYQTHRAIEMHPIISHFFRFWLWLTTGMITGEWVAIHRKHHALVEEEGDPHSPMIFGIKKVLFDGVDLYRKAARDRKSIEQYNQGTPTDWLERNIYSGFPKCGVITLLFIDLFLFGIPGLTIWGLQMITIPLFAAGIINGVGHYFGYRNYEVSDNSRNIVPLAFLLGGEELHNNHHACASSAKFSNKWWEFDIGWLYISVLKLFGLVKVKKLAPKLAVNPNKAQIDLDTLTAIVTNRFQVFSNYTTEVIIPVLRQEKKRADNVGGRLLRNAKKILKRNHADLSQSAKDYLSTLFDKCTTLSIVYDYRNRLQALWNVRNVTQAELLESLREWCRAAEATKVEVLQEFSRKLRCYVPVVAAEKS